MCVEKLIFFFPSALQRENGRQGSIWKDQQNRKCVFVPYKSKSLSFPLEKIEWSMTTTQREASFISGQIRTKHSSF